MTDIKAEDFLNGIVDGLVRWVDTSREELADFIEDRQIIELTNHFLKTGDRAQLAVLGFRLATYARNKNLEALMALGDTLTTAIVFAGNIALAFLRGPSFRVG